MVLLTMIACITISVLIHELGHVVALLFYGYKPKAISIGAPFKPIFRIPTKFLVNELWITPYFWGGSTVVSMPNGPTASRWLIINLAGPAINILVLCMIFLLRGSSDFILLAHLLKGSTLQVINFWAAFTVFNICYGIGELIPYLGRDGTNILKVLTGKYAPKTTQN